jgi:hypothetical protein
MLTRPADAVLNRHDIVAPAMHDGDRGGNVLRRIFFEARHVKGRRQQEQGARRQTRCRGGGHMPPHARAYEDQRTLEVTADLDEFFDPLAGVGHSAIIH